jgi:hypothetical protein
VSEIDGPQTPPPPPNSIYIYNIETFLSARFSAGPQCVEFLLLATGTHLRGIGLPLEVKTCFGPQSQSLWIAKKGMLMSSSAMDVRLSEYDASKHRSPPWTEASAVSSGLSSAWYLLPAQN